MARKLIMPKLGNSVETVVITEWHKRVGDTVRVGEDLCEVETDKTTMAVESEVEGVLLACLFDVDDEVAVLSPYAIVGDKGEDVSGVISDAGSGEASVGSVPESSGGELSGGSGGSGTAPGISPRARRAAASGGLQTPQITGPGSGPGGRVLEMDVQAMLKGAPRLTPAARKTLEASSEGVATAGTSASRAGTVGTATAGNSASRTGTVGTAAAGNSASQPGSTVASTVAPMANLPDEWQSVPIKGIRKVIAERMRNSLAGSAQLTLGSTVSADSLLRLRRVFKESPPERGLTGITINDLLMFAAAQTLPAHPQVNAHYLEAEGEIRQFRSVHLGFAVDSPRGLMVPVIRHANCLGLASLARESRRLATACKEGGITGDELSGSTFTITNLGMFGVEQFTPVINPPEAAILGVGAIIPRSSLASTSTGHDPGHGQGSPERQPVEQRLSLSFTFDHQALDGAPAARFLQDLVAGLSHLEWLLASQAPGLLGGAG